MQQRGKDESDFAHDARVDEWRRSSLDTTTREVSISPTHGFQSSTMAIWEKGRSIE
jgi:hypothetical protein